MDNKNDLLLQAQNVEQGLHAQAAQRAALQQQLSEVDNALGELENTSEAYRIIGNIMVKTSPEKMKTELSEKKESINARLQSVQRQETRFREQLEALQKEILKG